jgi:GTP-binding protein Era
VLSKSFESLIIVNNISKSGKLANKPEMMAILGVFLGETASQKYIVIGNKGDMLKLIGTEARKSIEGFLERKVFLKLWVKVSTGWSDDKRALASLGYD